MIKEWLNKKFKKSLEGKTLEEVWRVVPTIEMFHPVLQKSLDDELHIKDGSEFIQHVQEPVHGCFMFPLFSDRYCRFLIAEGDKKGTWGKNRKDQYTAFEITLFKLSAYISGYHKSTVIGRVINSVLAGLLDGYVTEEVENAFLIKYTLDTECKMDTHYDERSLISVSVNLNNKFRGGGLSFVREPENILVAPMGYAAMFAGNPLSRHRAVPITEGNRYVLVYWLS